MLSDIAFAWLCYGLSALTLIYVLWRMLSWMGFKEFRQVATVIVGAFLFTPVPVEPGSDDWAPAFMAVLIDLVTVSTEAAMSRLWPMLIVMLVMVVLSFAWRIYRYKSNQPAKGDS